MGLNQGASYIEDEKIMWSIGSVAIYCLLICELSLASLIGLAALKPTSQHITATHSIANLSLFCDPFLCLPSLFVYLMPFHGSPHHLLLPALPVSASSI